MYPPLTAPVLRIYNLASTTTAKTLRQLLNAALAGKSGVAAILPKEGLIQIILTPSADVAISDAITGDGFTIAAGARTVFPLQSALETLKLLNTATVSMEMYYDK